MEAMKQRATEQMEVMQEKTTLAVASAREQYDIKQTKKMSADEDRYARAWREQRDRGAISPNSAMRPVESRKPVPPLVNAAVLIASPAFTCTVWLAVTRSAKASDLDQVAHRGVANQQHT